MQSITGELTNTWPSILSELFSWESAFSEISSLINFSRCAFSFDIFIKTDFVIQKALVIGVLPIVLSLAVLTVYMLPHLVRYLVKRLSDCCKKGAKVEAYKVTDGYTGAPRNLTGAYFDDVAAAVVVLIYLVHPSVVRQTLAMISCQTLPDAPLELSLLKADLGVLCSEMGAVRLFFVIPVRGRHCLSFRRHFAKGSLPLLMVLQAALFCVAAPVFALSRVRKHKKSDRLRDARVQRRWGWLIRGYEPEYYFWEICVTLRKAGMAAVSVFFSDVGPQIQTCAALMVIQIALVMNVKHGPYTYRVQVRLHGNAGFLVLKPCLSSLKSAPFLAVPCCRTHSRRSA